MGFINSLKDEVKFLFSGKGMPYEKVCLTVAMIISVFLNELIAINNAMASHSSGGLTLNDRNLFNPAGSTSNTQTQGFLFFFGSMFFVFATIGMVPRLRLTKQLDKILMVLGKRLKLYCKRLTLPRLGARG